MKKTFLTLCLWGILSPIFSQKVELTIINFDSGRDTTVAFESTSQSQRTINNKALDVTIAIPKWYDSILRVHIDGNTQTYHISKNTQEGIFYIYQDGKGYIYESTRIKDIRKYLKPIVLRGLIKP